MSDIINFVRTNIRSLSPYSSARDEYSGGQAIFLDANENPYGTLNRYPDPHQRELKRKISEVKGIPEENIFVGNGSDESVDLLYRVFCTPGVDKVLTFTPTYGMYGVCADINDIGMVSVPLDENFDIPGNAPDIISQVDNLKVIIICTPNNPTGNSLSRSRIETILKSFKGIVAIDEAYIDFCSRPSFLKALSSFPNLVIFQTFSKAWGLAAARVGLAFASQEIISFFNKVKYPYNVSYLNQQAALEALGKNDEVRKTVRKIIEQRDVLSENLEKTPGVKKVYPSDSNFLLIKTDNATHVYEELVKRGIIVRNRSSVIRDCLRITVGTPEENNKLKEAIREITK